MEVGVGSFSLRNGLLSSDEAISEFPPLSDKPALQRFLGIVNFYRKLTIVFSFC